MDKCKDLIKLIKSLEGRKDVKITVTVKNQIKAFAVVDRDTKTFHGVAAVTDLDFMMPVKIGNEEQLLALRQHGMPYPPFCDAGIEHIARFYAAFKVKTCEDAVAYDDTEAGIFIRARFKGNANRVLAHPRFEPLVKDWATKFSQAKNVAMTDTNICHSHYVMYLNAVKALKAFRKSYDSGELQYYLLTVDSEFKYKGCFVSRQQNVNAIAVEKKSQTSVNELAMKIVENAEKEHKREHDTMQLLISKIKTQL
jgi:hypothetical protein